MTVSIKPMPERYRNIPKRLLPGHPPIFADCGEAGPTEVFLKGLIERINQSRGKKGRFPGIRDAGFFCGVGMLERYPSNSIGKK